MKKVVFMQSISKKYIEVQNKVRKNQRLLDAFKLITTILIFVFVIGIYGYFVNISSTKGYFLRQELSNLEKAKFDQSIVQLEVLKLEKQVWDDIKINQPINQRKMQINERIIYLPVNNENKTTELARSN